MLVYVVSGLGVLEQLDEILEYVELEQVDVDAPRRTEIK